MSRRWAKFVTSVVGAEAEASMFMVLLCFAHFRDTDLLDSIVMMLRPAGSRSSAAEERAMAK